jgi:hypothetical protein
MEEELMNRSLFVVIFVAACFPVVVSAGNLEPSAPPGPTMKSFNEIPPAWSLRLDSTNGSSLPSQLGCNSSRFKCIWYEGTPLTTPQAVLDMETGLVWERSPEYPNEPWELAVRYCHILEVGGRKGWRLPTVEELASLVDSSQSSPALPEGHPFYGLHFAPADTYWTQTRDVELNTSVWFVSLADGSVNAQTISGLRYVWCVRGGHGTGGV